MATLFDSASLVMIPSGVKEDKLYSIKPTDGSGDFTFSRGSDIQATRVNASGLIEKAKVNLLLQSNTFSNASWIKSSASITGGQSGYDGMNNASLLEATSAGGQLIQSISLGGVHTASVYAKAGTADGIRLRIDQTSDANAYVNLIDGSVRLQTSTIDIDIQDVSNGWYRITYAFNGSNAVGFYLYPTDGDTTSVAGNILIQDAQLNHGLIAQDYVETTTTAVVEGLTADLPRLDYSGGASCPSLLLEPSRSNLITQSEYIGAWTTNGISLTANNSISPEGVQNAYLSTSDGVNGVHRFYELITFTSGTTYTFSIFAKADTNDFFQIYLGNPFDVSGGQVYANFDLSDGSKGTAGSNVDDYDIEAVGTDGWYRCYLTAESQLTGATGVFYNIVPNASATRGLSSDVSGSVQFYGAGTEEGSYPTSYIPTYGTAAVRGVESYEKTSATDLIGQTEGVLFVDFTPNTDIVSTKWLAFLGSGTDYIGIYGVNGTNKIRLEVGDGGTQATFDTTNAIVEGQRYKCAIAYKQNDFVAYVNGVQLGTDSSGSVPATSTIRSYYNLSSIDSTDTHQLLVFKTRLTNAELESLTTI